MNNEHRIPKNIEPQTLVRAIINASYWHWKTIDKVQHTEAITYLNRLESIDNVKPNEAIECLEKIKDSFSCDMAYYDLNIDYEIVEQALLKSQEMEKENAILKGQVNYLTEIGTEYQKILKIIKEKDVDIYILRSCETVDEYNSKIVHIVGETRELTQEEFDLVKGMLG